MADVTISDLELAPALADDMVFPVENTTDTYAATLAMLRRLINKTFVEVEDADFNDLTDDGFYQCTGTPTNAPEAGTINWTLQVSAESGVVVQRAFSLDDNFANLYIRRWNGVTWTGWIDVGKGALDNKANINLSNVNNTGNAAASNLNSKGIRTVVETYRRGTNWYRVYSDDFVEQGGSQTFNTTTTTLTLLVPVSVLYASGIRATINHTTPESNPMIGIVGGGTKIQVNTGSGASEYFFWKVEGFKQ